ncbi:MAG TPA: ATP-binding cassette domain-containing protein [Holophagaceae bacterium]|nr:ATP-binding cassette domain-containing protein [Holophagaceae bacterium]
MAEAATLSASGLALRAMDGRVILEEASLELGPGRRAWIEGPPGSGKRALLKVLAGLLKPDRGEVRLGTIRLWPGEGATELRKRLRIGFAFAQGGLLSNQTLRENLALPLCFAGQGAEAYRIVDEALAGAGLGPFSALRPHALGARVRRLAQLVRIDLLRPDAIFLCEPLEDLEGPDLLLAAGLIEGWAEDPARLILASAEQGAPGLLPGAVRLRLEAGRIHSDEGPP